MTKEEFLQLLKRYKEGECSLMEQQQLDEWFEVISNEDLELNEWEKEHFHSRILNVVRPSLVSQKQTKLRTLVSVSMKLAAGLLIIALAYFALSPQSPWKSHKMTSDSSIAELVTQQNQTATTLFVTLPDSSSVTLDPGAQIQYSKTWNQSKRNVYLKGAAFFNVIRNPKKPFYVYAGKIITKVLGTSFSVNAPENGESFKVAVRTGKVSVYENLSHDTGTNEGQERSGVILTPNEKVEYFAENKHWVTSLVETPARVPSIAKASDFIFSSTQISEIIKCIERNYSIDIVIENETASSCTFTGDVSMMELYDMLDVICKSTNSSYEVKGTKILITEHECE